MQRLDALATARRNGDPGPDAARRTPDDRRLFRLVALALPVAVWVLLIFSPRQGGLTLAYVATFTLLLAALTLVDQTAPGRDRPLAQRLAWLGVEILLAYLVVREHGTFIRPTFVYLLPAMRALLMFDLPAGFLLSLTVWPAYALNIWEYAWPDRLEEYRTYLLFFLAPYVLTVVLTTAALRQAEDRRRVQALYDDLNAAHAELQALHERVRETAVAEERNRLAREIHDSLAHYLTVINVQLEAAEKLYPADAALEQLLRARRLTLECLQEVRRSVAALRASSLDELSLPRALEKLAAGFSESTGLPVRVSLEIEEQPRLPPETALALYRVAQEGLTNVHRHARATIAALSLTRSDDHIRLAVEDDGVGPPAAGTEDGFGLLGLRERVALLGGQLSFERVSSGGSRLAVRLPLAGSGRSPTEADGWRHASDTHHSFPTAGP
jgi:signal transduction histidine kinase